MVPAVRGCSCESGVKLWMLGACCGQRAKRRLEADVASSAGADDPRNLQGEAAALRAELAQLDQSPEAVEQSQIELPQVLFRSLDESAQRAADAAVRRGAEADALLDTEWHAAIAASLAQSEVVAQRRGSADAAEAEQDSLNLQPEPQPDDPHTDEPEPAPEP